jgi:hypothetical protein
MAFPEGDMFEILPSLCKRFSPLENILNAVTAHLNVSGYLIYPKRKCGFLRRKLIKPESWIRLCLNKGEAKKICLNHSM